MSNLKLKSKTDPISLHLFLGNRTTRILGYETTVTRMSEGEDSWFKIKHHGSTVARIHSWQVEVSNAGYSSPTTRNRLGKILNDNRIPFYVGQKNFDQLLYQRAESSGSRDSVITEDFQAATFQMQAGLWTLAALDNA
jgi:hypothetical protein